MNISDKKETLLVTNADLSGSSFTDVNLRAAQFADVNLSQAAFTDIDFSGSRFSNVKLSAVEIEDCDVSGMKIQGVLLSELLRVYEQRALATAGLGAARRRGASLRSGQKRPVKKRGAFRLVLEGRGDGLTRIAHKPERAAPT